MPILYSSTGSNLFGAFWGGGGIGTELASRNVPRSSHRWNADCTMSSSSCSPELQNSGKNTRRWEGQLANYSIDLHRLLLTKQKDHQMV